MSLNVNAAMDAIGTRLRTISGLRVYDHPADSIAVPAAIVSHPDTVTYDTTYGRAADMAVFQVTVIVGKVSDRVSRDQLEEYRAGVGAKSVKTVLDGDLGAVIKTGRVTQASALTLTVGGVEYAAATFDYEVFA